MGGERSKIQGSAFSLFGNPEPVRVDEFMSKLKRGEFQPRCTPSSGVYRPIRPARAFLFSHSSHSSHSSYSSHSSHSQTILPPLVSSRDTADSPESPDFAGGQCIQQAHTVLYHSHSLPRIPQRPICTKIGHRAKV